MRIRIKQSVGAFGAVALAASLVASCSSSGSKAATTSTTSSKTSIPSALYRAVAAHAYSVPGPRPVGVLTLTLPKGNKVEVWYPAVQGTTGTVTYDVRDFVPPSITKLLTAKIPATFTIDAKRGATVAPGRFPLVLFSHGFSGIRLQSSYLTSHLASWGMIVAAPDHPSRDLYHALQFKLGNQADSVADLEATRTLITEANGDARSPLHGHVDTSHIAAVGHSAGGGTVEAAAIDDPQIDGYVSLASGVLGNGRASDTGGTTTTTTPRFADKPSLFVAGANDQVAELARVVEPAYAAAPTPTRLWVIDKTGHNAFDDFCTLGNGKGIIGLAEASGLGPLLASPTFASFKKLGSDGCERPDVPVRDVWPIIKHVVTAFLRQLLGLDPKPGIGLDANVAKQYPVSVRIEARLG